MGGPNQPTTAQTPIERRGSVWVKRDDVFEVAGVCGGKARSCWMLAQGAKGLTTGSARHSPQQQIVSRIAELLGVPCHVHTANGGYTAEMNDAVLHGAVIYQHYNGYSNVLHSRADADARQLGWTCIPFGMECYRSVQGIRNQVRSLAGVEGVRRYVITVGSGVTASGLLWGLHDLGSRLPVLGVRVGGGVTGQNIERRLDRLAPKNWRLRMELVQSPVPYDCALDVVLDGLTLDPHYEAKCYEFLREGDLFWVVGRRPTLGGKP